MILGIFGSFYNVVSSIIFCSKEARASIVLDIQGNERNLSRKIVKKCRIIGLNRARKNKFCSRSV